MAILIIILLIPFKGRVYIKYDNNDIDCNFELYLFFIRIKLPHGKRKQDDADKSHKSEQKTEDNKNKGGKIWGAIKTVTDNLPQIKKIISAILGYIFKHLIKIKEFAVHAEIGVDDAMNTALIYGALSGFVYNILGIMDEYMRLKKYDVDIKPDFNIPHIRAEVKAILSTNILHLIILTIIAAIYIVPLWLKIKKKEKNNG